MPCICFPVSEDDVRREYLGKACQRLWERFKLQEGGEEKSNSEHPATPAPQPNFWANDHTVTLLDLLGRVLDAQARVSAKRRNPTLALDEEDDYRSFSIYRTSWNEAIESALRAEMRHFSSEGFVKTLLGPYYDEIEEQNLKWAEQLHSKEGEASPAAPHPLVFLLLRELQSYITRCPTPVSMLSFKFNAFPYLGSPSSRMF